MTDHSERGPLGTDRLEAFSDGVLAIIITIMILDLHAPEMSHAALGDLVELKWKFVGYVLSFVYIGIYWNNHHHMLRVARHLSGAVMWANLHLLFWLSLVPFVTSWMGNNHFAPMPTAVYGAVLFLAGVAFNILQATIVAADGKDSAVGRATGGDTKGKMSLVLYAMGIGLSFVDQRIAGALYVAVALMWLVPDRRMVNAAPARGAGAHHDSKGRT